LNIDRRPGKIGRQLGGRTLINQDVVDEPTGNGIKGEGPFVGLETGRRGIVQHHRIVSLLQPANHHKPAIGNRNARHPAHHLRRILVLAPGDLLRRNPADNQTARFQGVHQGNFGVAPFPGHHLHLPHINGDWQEVNDQFGIPHPGNFHLDNLILIGNKSHHQVVTPFCDVGKHKITVKIGDRSTCGSLNQQLGPHQGLPGFTVPHRPPDVPRPRFFKRRQGNQEQKGNNYKAA